MYLFLLRFLCFHILSLGVLARTPYLPYHNVFFDPAFVVEKRYDNSTLPAQDSIIQWADFLDSEGVWSVVNKSFVPTDASVHDFTSFAPYSWPDCSKIDNKTELTPEEVWFQCPYFQRDGQFNPDYLAVNNSGAFNAMSDAVLYNALAWGITGSQKYSRRAVDLIQTWFLNPETAMNPNMNYAQLLRGPGGQEGSSLGVLQLRMSCKIITSILLLRKGNSAEWTSDIDARMRTWSSKYLSWLRKAKNAQGAKNIPNNHATFYYNQCAAFQILVDDFDAARKSLQEYFHGPFQDQIRANGEQPREAARTKPYHYRSFNALGASINARLAQYVGYDDAWTMESSKGGTIQKAVNYILKLDPPPPPDPGAIHSDPPTQDLFPTVGMVSQRFGDPKGEYRAFLEKSIGSYWEQPWAFWEQIPQPETDNSKDAAGDDGDTASSENQNAENGGLHSAYFNLVFVVTAPLLIVHAVGA